MTNKKHDPRVELLRLADFLVEDIWDINDETLLAEAIEENIDVDNVVSQTRELISNAIEKSGKRRMSAAKDGVQRLRQSPSEAIKAFPFERKHEIIRQVYDQQAGDLTVAARKEDELSESDIDSVLEAMIELGVIDSDGEIL